MLFDDAASPVVRTGIAQGAENALQMHGTVSGIGQFQFNRIDWHCFRILEVTLAVYKSAEGTPDPVWSSTNFPAVIAETFPGSVI
jgi:hypothetical protein